VGILRRIAEEGNVLFEFVRGVASVLEHPMDTFTLPAHIEGGSVLLDAPLPANVQSVEVRVTVATPQPNRLSSLIRLIENFPPGTKTGEEIDAEIEEIRDGW